MKRYLPVIITFIKVTFFITLLYLLIYGFVYYVFEKELFRLTHSILFILAFSALSTFRYKDIELEVKTKNGYDYTDELIDILKHNTLFKFKHNEHNTITIDPSIIDRLYTGKTIIHIKQDTILFKGPKSYVYRIIKHLDLVERKR
ncbi:hypothetical protein [Haloplasma contractile]|uniref:Uncharacterized protein n=1 Tax=Haloplasma contractile SSD-17B TaxID=1033810 RepID=F7PU02_9MOLU|nr:hypothetical protein [Haloplasma contractile]ERJ12187.1 hypothetical protein HLPCO_001714 [Haloplasma contractile SSD-17B]